jgi:signal peptidase I
MARATRESKRKFKKWQSQLAVVLVGLGLVGWWRTMAPTWIGGPVTIIVVEGHSMEPFLHTGDAVLVHEQRSYHVGELVLLNFDGGHVIHRLVRETPERTWISRGDNNTYDDPWIIRRSNIAGSYWKTIPKVGGVAVWLLIHPLALGALYATTAFIVLLPWRRRNYPPVLRRALTHAMREPAPPGRGVGDVGVAVGCGVAALSCLFVLGIVGATGRLMSLQGLLVGVAFVWSGGFALYFLSHIFDGRGLIEPDRSLYALSGRLWWVTTLPDLREPATKVRSAVELRRIAEQFRLPILHFHDSSSQRHEFLLLSAKRGAFLWSVEVAE